MRTPSTRWRVVLPVKGGRTAKSRLARDAAARRQLAEAVALDTLAAALACPAVDDVVVVTGDARAAAAVTAAGARVVDESVPGAGLDAAVRDALAVLPDAPLAVLLADVPALRPGDLCAALEGAAGLLAAGAPSVVVPDAEGTGTVLLAAPGPRGLRTAFGPGSAAAHEALGAVRFEPDLPRLRRDVDTPADLEQALALGVGPRTAELSVGRQPA